MINAVIRFCLENKLIVLLVMVASIVAGAIVAPFDWELPGLERHPVPVDAIPDIGENQQIVFTEWMGRSPQDVDDQITYPLTTALLGLPAVKTIRSYSYFGYSAIYVVFKESAEFYWSRSRLLEKLNSLPAGTLPTGVVPVLGPDATALGQIFWYTLEGRDAQGNPAPGWELEELRRIQDWYVRYALQGVDGVAEVASVGGFVQEYQIDVDPDAMRAYEVTLAQVFDAVRKSNIDVGARTIEVNSVEYVIRGRGFIRSVEDLRQTVVRTRDHVPVLIDHVATVSLGPALRRGALDKEGAEAVGGVVVARYGENPLAVIKRVKHRIAEIAPGLGTKVLPDGRVSSVTVVPFYDRTGLIRETLGTLDSALTEEILITIIVVIVMVWHLRSALLISGLLPLAVLMCFIAMSVFGVDANVVALSGIAIAIGTMVDMGIVLAENMLKHLEEAPPEESRLEVIFRGASEVGSAVLTAVLTTVVSFLPVFTMEAAEGKLFKPLAWTKTFALLASIVVALTIIPPFAHVLLGVRLGRGWGRRVLGGAAILAAVVLGLAAGWWWAAAVLAVAGAWPFAEASVPERVRPWAPLVLNVAVAVWVALVLSEHWMPLGPARGAWNAVFVLGVVGGLLAVFTGFIRIYGPILRWCLDHKLLFAVVPTALVATGFTVWLGFDPLWSWALPGPLARSAPAVWARHAFPGLGKEFMPALGEGSFLYMPTTMPHASIGESLDALRKQDMAIRAIPEVDGVVGKIGRVDSPLDPAPISMVETVISYKPEYRVDDNGYRLRYRWDGAAGDFARDADGALIPDADGRPYRQWRPEIHTEDDIWDAIVAAAQVPGSTSAPRLQPIETRLVMLQTGMRAPMGVKVYGPDLATIQDVGFQIERFLKEVPQVEPTAVLADRIVGKPYLEIEWDRRALQRYGLSVRAAQDVVEVAIGGRRVTSTVEGRERYPVRVRYVRELRDQIETLDRILVAAPDGTQVPIGELADITYTPGPMVIKSEDTFLVGYVILDRRPPYAEVEVVEQASAYLAAKQASGEFHVPPGVNYKFAGSYENQVRAERRLRLVLPLALFAIFIILYLQFRRVTTTLAVFTGVAVAWAGGFLLLWCYGQDWFLAGGWFGVDWRALFQVHPMALSIAVWVGFLALFGIATDDGVVMATYLKQSFEQEEPDSVAGIRAATCTAGMRRVRPCIMTTATTILALLPVLTATGRGADVMVPMAIPSVGGMTIELITMFVVPVLFCTVAEFRRRTRWSAGAVDGLALATLGLAFVPMLLTCVVGDIRDRRGRRAVEADAGPTP